MNSFAQVLSNVTALIPESLQTICNISLTVIENASNDQIAKAIQHNQHEINTLLVQLLAINLITQTQNEIKKDLNIPQNDTNDNNSSNNVAESQTIIIINVEEYCERKLLSLSPIDGFSRKNFLAKSNVSDDVRIEILSYLKPIEIFKNISLINKQFNQNVIKIHQSHKYSNMFCGDNFAYQSLDDISSTEDHSRIDIDWRMDNGQWISGWLDKINKEKMLAYVSANWCPYKSKTGKIVFNTADCSRVAPVGSMSQRPASMNKFSNLLKHGYCSATCDVNLRNFYFRANGRYIHIISGYANESEYFAHGNGQAGDDEQDIWQCGQINFHSIYSMNKNNLNRLMWIEVSVDITQAYNNHPDTIRQAIRHNECFRFKKMENDERFVRLMFHIDDIKNITYFGDKTTLEQQLKIKQRLFNDIILNYDSIHIDKHKRRLLKASGYPGYCCLTHDGVFSALSQSRNQVKLFYTWARSGKYDMICENECRNVKISQNGVNKVYYDKIKDELRIKVLQKINGWYRCVLDDENAPKPLDKRYDLPHGSLYRLMDAKIIDPRLVDKVQRESINDVNKKQKRYFKLLKKWKGFIQISIDITKEFDQFQEKLKKDYVDFYKKNGTQVGDELMVKLNNRKYFMNGINYDKTKDKIIRNVYVLLDNKMIYHYDARLNLFDIFAAKQENMVTTKIFNFVGRDEFDRCNVALVCKKWHHANITLQ